MTAPTDRSMPSVPITSRHAQRDEQHGYRLEQLYPQVVQAEEVRASAVFTTTSATIAAYTP